MKWKTRFLGVSVGILFVLFAAILSATDEVTITGMVYPVSWDQNKRPTEAIIMIEGGGYYTIVNDTAGQGLCELMYMDVRVTGLAGEDSEGKKTITVVEYEIVTKKGKGAAGK
jgi:hypothetical protein